MKFLQERRLEFTREGREAAELEVKEKNKKHAEYSKENWAAGKYQSGKRKGQYGKGKTFGKEKGKSQFGKSGKSKGKYQYSGSYYDQNQQGYGYGNGKGQGWPYYENAANFTTMNNQQQLQNTGGYNYPLLQDKNNNTIPN